MSTLRYWKNQTYHFAHNSIQCGADRESCEVFEVDLGAGVRRVLALTEKDAEEAYQDELCCQHCGGFINGYCYCD